MSDPVARPSSAGRGRGDGAGKVAGRSGRGRVAGVRRPAVAAARDVEPGSESDDPPPAPARPTVSRPSATASAVPKTLLATKAGAEKTAALDGVPKPAAPRPKSLTRRPSEAEKPRTASAAKSKSSSSASASDTSQGLSSSSGSTSSGSGSTSSSTSVRSKAPPSSSGGLQIKALALSLFPVEKEAQVDDLVIARLPKVIYQQAIFCILPKHPLFLQ
jgi:hypothetical protein